MDDYTSAIEILPNFEVPYYNRGLIRYRLGKVVWLAKVFKVLKVCCLYNSKLCYTFVLIHRI